MNLDPDKFDGEMALGSFFIRKAVYQDCPICEACFYIATYHDPAGVPFAFCQYLIMEDEYAECYYDKKDCRC